MAGVDAYFDKLNKNWNVSKFLLISFFSDQWKVKKFIFHFDLLKCGHHFFFNIHFQKTQLGFWEFMMNFQLWKIMFVRKSTSISSHEMFVMKCIWGKDASSYKFHKKWWRFCNNKNWNLHESVSVFHSFQKLGVSVFRNSEIEVWRRAWHPPKAP